MICHVGQVGSPKLRKGWSTCQQRQAGRLGLIRVKWPAMNTAPPGGILPARRFYLSEFFRCPPFFHCDYDDSAMCKRAGLLPHLYSAVRTIAVLTAGEVFVVKVSVTL